MLCPPKRRRYASAIHHIWPKGMGGCDLNTRLNPLNGIPVCDECHCEIHDSIGEVAGRERIMEVVPALKTINHKTHGFGADTKLGILIELREMKAGLS